MQQLGAPYDVKAACERLITLSERALDVETRRHAGADDRLQEPLIRYMLALFRMRVKPALHPGWLQHDPVHIVLFGGTNSGKSTVVNVCLGRAAAGMQATARFSQYPEAYRIQALGNTWLDTYPSRFAGYTRYEDTRPPRQSDSELLSRGYRLAVAVLDPTHTPAPPITMPATTTAVFWDAPDFSTEAAQTYMGTVLDVAALGDMVIMAITDESYADDRVATLLRLVSSGGAELHIVANKLPPGDELLKDIRAKINDHWRGPGHSLPMQQWHHLPRVSGQTPEQRLSALLVSPQAVTLRDTIAQAAEQRVTLKRQVLDRTLKFIDSRLEDVLQVLAAEIEVAIAWERTVTRLIESECLERYRRDYLQAHRYGEFNQVLVRVMEALEVPGIGPLMKRLRSAVRLPFRLLTGWLKKGWNASSGAPHLFEAEVLMELVEHCLAALKSEAQTLADSATHPGWSEVARGLDSHTWRGQVIKEFEAAYALYRQTVDREVQQRAAAIYQTISERPRLRNVLRGANLALDAATVALVVKSGGLDWSDAVVGPLVAGVRRTLIEAGLAAYISRQSEILKQKQTEALRAFLITYVLRPVCSLFPGTVHKEEIDTARRDYATVKAAIHRLVEDRQG